MRAEKNTRDHLRSKRTGVSRRCNFIHSRIHHHPASLPFSGTLKKTRSGCTIGGGSKGRGGAINASNARAHERPEGSSRFQNACICTEQRECRGALTAIRAPRVLLSLRQLPTSLLPSRVCTCVSAIRNCAHPHAHECEQERASERANFSRGILAGRRYRYRQRIPTTSGNSVTDGRNPVAPIVEIRYLSWEYQTLYSTL